MNNSSTPEAPSPRGASDASVSATQETQTDHKKAVFTHTAMVQELAKMCGQSQKLVREILESHNAVVLSALRQYEKVVLGTIGSLSPKEVPARTVRNPQTGQPHDVGRSVTVRFRASSLTKKELINEHLQNKQL